MQNKYYYYRASIIMIIILLGRNKYIKIMEEGYGGEY
jgi:hypothetical protein